MKEQKPSAFVRLPRFLIRDFRIPIAQRLLLGILRSFCWRGDECWPSAETLSKMLGCSPRQFFRHARALEKLELIRRRPMDQTNPKSSTIYTLFEKEAEIRLQKLADPDRKLVTPMSVGSLTPMSHEVEEVLKAECKTPTPISGPSNIIQMTPKKRKKKAL